MEFSTLLLLFLLLAFGAASLAIGVWKSNFILIAVGVVMLVIFSIILLLQIYLRNNRMNI